MNTPENTPMPELLSAFLDGELDSLREAMLFRHLADNQDMRLEFRESLALRAAVHGDREVLLPPERLLQSSMQRAGLLPPEAARGKRVLPALLLTLLRKQRAPIIAALLAAMLTALVFLSMEPVPATRGYSAAPALPSAAAPAPRGGVGEQQAARAAEPAGQTAGKGAGTTPARQAVRAEREAAHGASDVSAPAATTPPARAQRENARLAHSIPLQAAPVLHPNAQRSVHSMPAERRPAAASATAVPLPGAVPAGGDEHFLSDFRLHLRGFAARSFPDATIAPSSDPWFNNMALALAYATERDNSRRIILEAGQEPYYQEFRRREAGLWTRYEQSATLFWLALGYEQSFAALELPGGLYPMARLSLGGCRQGPLARAMLGLEYRGGERLALHLGLEGSALFYRFDNNWFTSRKLGLSYGLSYQW